MEEKHTPGPWKVEHTFGEMIIRDSEDYPIATMTGEDSDNEARANAYLIARAPELLEQVAALTKQEERLQQLLKSAEETNKALTEQVEKSKAHFITVTTDYQKQVNDLIEERADRIAELEKLKADKDAWIEETVSREKELSRLREERKELVEALRKRLNRLGEITGYSSGFSDIHLEMDFLKSLLDKFNDSNT